jgi:predicted nucleic acid-binding protein
VVTLAELSLGIHLAADDEVRARRLETLGAVQANYRALPIDDTVAAAFATLVALARRDGRRPKVQDAWIAATARAHDVAVFTQDSDFDDLAVDVARI